MKPSILLATVLILTDIAFSDTWVSVGSTGVQGDDINVFATIANEGQYTALERICLASNLTHVILLPAQQRWLLSVKVP